MPAPQPDRANFLLYLRSEFPYCMDFLTLHGECIPYRVVYEAMQQFRDEQPDIYRILWLHTHTRLPRDHMVDLTYFDTSTVKRRINFAIDRVATLAGFQLTHPDTTARVPTREHVFARNHFLSYLATGFRDGLDYEDLRGEVVGRHRILHAIERLKDNDPKFSRMFMYHVTSRLPRTQVAKAADADPSTVKRRTNYAADLVMQRARHSPDLDPDQLDELAFYRRLGTYAEGC